MRDTSLLAYIDVQSDDAELAGMYRSIKAVLRKGAATDREIAALLGYTDPNKVRPRRNELMREGEIELHEKRRCRITGKTAIAWRIREVPRLQVTGSCDAAIQV